MGLYTRRRECYIFSVPSGYVKVGVSDDYRRRLREIQQTCYEPVTYEMASTLSDGSPVDAFEMEQLVHRKLQPYAAERREWFRTSVDIVMNVWLTVHWFLAIPPDHADIERVHPNMECHLAKYRKTAA